MASLVACAEPGFEPIEGYVLREKLGVGGYGEVWLADAPGGLKKAIKFVFGTVTGDRASSELKALQRIRQANHPFLLSLERIEIVDDQLIIVTELADGSLHDRLVEYRNRGEAGIPRDRLLEHMRDAADALDFLCLKHDLQHLDVKPGNLLLVADRVKVADFGLIKDVQSSSMSMLSGLTPTYAAPEMFDGRPGRYSDQYSLAIVYQELLTGTVPFQGRTTAQLASEHMHKAPNLDAVPLADRPVLAKALAKKPSQRFSSCRELIDHLASAKPLSPSKTKDAPILTASPSPIQVRTPPLGKIAIQPEESTNNIKRLSRSTQRAHPGSITTLPPLDSLKPGESSNSPALFIGLGGTGGEILKRLRNQLKCSGIDVEHRFDLAWLFLDTDVKSVEAVCDEGNVGRLPTNSALAIPLKAPVYYRDQVSERFSPISRRWLYNVPRSGRTEGVRPLAMLAFLDHAQLCFQVIDQYVAKLKAQKDSDSIPAPTIRVYLIASAHGGTGSALVGEIGFMLRHALAKHEVSATIQVLLTVGKNDQSQGSELASCVAMTCLEEFSSYVRTGGLHPGWPDVSSTHSSSKAPFDFVYLVDGGILGQRAGWDAAIGQASDYLMMDACTELGGMLDLPRQQSAQIHESSCDIDWTPWLRTIGSNWLDLSAQTNPEHLAKRVCSQAIQRWIMRLDDDRIAGQVSTQPNTKDIKSKEFRRKTEEQLKVLVNDLFRQRRWTAQAWLQECLSQIVIPDSSSEPIDEYPLSSAIDQLMESSDDDSLDSIAIHLGIDAPQIQFQIRHMLDHSLSGLTHWLRTSFLQSPPAWGHLVELLRVICQRFHEQSATLLDVSARLNQEYEKCMKRSQASTPLGNRADDQAPNPEAIENLQAQSRLHKMAAKMLLRLAEHVRHMEQTWQAEACSLRLRLQAWLQLTLASSNQVEQAPEDSTSPDFPLPAAWEQIRSHALKTFVLEIEQLASYSLCKAWRLNIVDSDSMKYGSALQDPHSEAVHAITEMEHCDSNSRRVKAPHGSMILDHNLMSKLLQSTISSTSAAADQLGLGYLATNAQGATGNGPSGLAATEQLNRAFAPLLRWGGAKRWLLLLPLDGNNDQANRQWSAAVRDPVTIVKIPKLPAPLLLCDGEQLVLSEIISQMWTPSSQQWQLAERLRVRTDIEWLSPD